MMMADAGEDAAFLEPENPIPWRSPPLFNAAAHAPSQGHTHASPNFHLSAQARSVVDVQPHTPPLPFVFYDEDIISDNSAARVPIFTDVIQQTPSLINTLSSHPAYAGVPFPHNVYPWGIYTYSSASQGHGHSNCPDPKSPEDCILISPQSSAEPPNRPLPLMDIAAITTRVQPGRLWSDSTNSEPSAISRHQITGSPEDCSALDADGPPDACRSKRKRQLESNRKAAKKCRQKVKDQEKGLEDREKQCKELNSVLHAQASALKDEVLSLKNEILSHSGCDCALIKQYISSSAMEM